MSEKYITPICHFIRDALAGIGILYFAYLLGLARLNVTSMEISASQAENIAVDQYENARGLKGGHK